MQGVTRWTIEPAGVRTRARPFAERTRRGTPVSSRRLILILILAGLAVAPARAQSLYGPGGLFLHPTATFPERGQVTPAFLVLPQHDPVEDSTRTWQSASLSYGLRDDLEIGVTHLKVAGWDRNASYGGFFKYRLLEESQRCPAVAVGFTQLGFGDVNTRLGFLALRKQLSRPERRRIVGHLGVQYADEVDGISRHEFQPYAGLELGLTSRLTFIAEARPRMNAEFGTPLALTLSYQVSDRWKLAVTWANNGRSDTPKFGIGVGVGLPSRGR